MMEGKATAEEQAAKSALGGRIQSIRRKFRRGRADESGLTTLEWLLIVAAVAGLAALAVVLVQNVVDDTAREISGSSARETAAKVAASAVVEESKAAKTFDDTEINSWSDWDLYFTAKCERIGITYSDADVTIAADFAGSTDAFSAAEIATATDAGAAAIPKASCEVT